VADAAPRRATIALVRPLTGLSALGVGVAAALLLAAAPAAAAPATTSAASKSKKLGANQVVHAFAASGLKMFNPLLGAEQGGVVTLTVENPGGPYSIGVTIYPSTREAGSVYHGSSAEWVQSGFDVALRGNVVVTVVPKGASLGRKPRSRIPMPAAVAKSIGILAADLAR
jgi:hypothetical protein